MLDPLPQLLDAIWCLSFIISHLNLTWLNTLCLFSIRSHLNLNWSNALCWVSIDSRVITLTLSAVPYLQHLQPLSSAVPSLCPKHNNINNSTLGCQIFSAILVATVSLLLQPHLGSCPPHRLQNGHVICHTMDETNIPLQSPWTSCRTDFIGVYFVSMDPVPSKLGCQPTDLNY